MRPNCTPLCPYSERLFFTTFPSHSPSADTLNELYGDGLDPLPVRNLGSAYLASASCTPDKPTPYYFFTFDSVLQYNSFYLDWGPLNLAMVYKACLLIHELLSDEDLTNHRIVMYSSDEPKPKANGALLIALYSLIVMHYTPWEAFRPIAELEFMTFRDAGRGCSDFNLSVQDCLWGVWKAVQHGLCDMSTFSVEEYEFYEKVENGDWNWITPGFIAFASPSDPEFIKNKRDGVKSATALHRKLSTPFQNCLKFFEEREVKLVVRLNNMLYDRSTFLERNIDHVELFFEDGTNPTDEIVRSFIDMADRVITGGGVVAVHCKAGLGRTGTLIGAYLIWKYGFTANEAIGFMRIARPGSVVGPQQQYMYLKQTEWSKWAAVDELKRSQAPQQLPAAETNDARPVTPPPVQTPATPPDDDIDEISGIRPLVIPVTPSKHIAKSEAAARAIATPGQPRKTPKGKFTTAEIIEESEEDDEISALPMTNIKPLMFSKLPRTTLKRKAPASEHKRTATRSGFENTNSDKLTRSPYKVAKLGAGASASARRPLEPPSPTPVRKLRPISPAPSRLPQPSIKKPLASRVDFGDNGWMSAKAPAVVEPNAKSGRPLLRPVRRRRSSFSAVE